MIESRELQIDIDRMYVNLNDREKECTECEKKLVCVRVCVSLCRSIMYPFCSISAAKCVSTIK